MEPKKKPNAEVKRKMFGLAFEKLINISMKNHIYSFKSVYRVQEDSGSTGLDLTGEVSDLFMLWWDAQFSKALESLLVKSDLSLRFKDDINIIADKIPLAHSLIHKYFGNDFMSQLSEISQTELTANLF